MSIRSIFEDQWDINIIPAFGRPQPNVHPIIGDITKQDLAQILKNADRVIVFWDAHGFEVAAWVFSHLMPLIADKPHVVFCHDISDSRLGVSDENLSYGGKRMWRGYDDYIQDTEKTATAYIHWLSTGMDQSISILDFCFRNRMTLCSVDHDVIIAGSPELKAALSPLYDLETTGFALTYFTLNETLLRHFPAG